MQRPSSEAIIIAVVLAIVVLPVLAVCGWIVFDRHFSRLGTKQPNTYKVVHSAIVAADERAAAEGKATAWPVKGQWASSSDYFRAVLPRRIRNEVLSPGRSCCILAGAKDEDDAMPFLWSSNFRITLEDILAPIDPTNEVSWAGKLVPGGNSFGTWQVVLVRRNGSFQVIKNKDLTDAAFLGGAVPRHPESLEILEP